MSVFLSCFAFATMIGWGFYGLQCVQYLLGDGAWKPFIFLQVAICTGSVLLETGTVWLLAEMMNGLMAIPNLICLGTLTPALLETVRIYKKEERL
jgi:AGCS family alanine or glycine:cation symporter